MFSIYHAKSQAADSCKSLVEGLIFDRTNNEPIPFASVKVQGETKGTVADENGRFLIEGLCGDEFDLIFSHIGYKEISHHHDVYHPMPTIYLAPNQMLLEGIVVEGELESGGLSSGTVGRLSTKELEIGASENLGDLIGNIAGVSVLKTGQNVVKPVIHGLHSSRILMINNGIRHEYHSWGAEHAPEIDPSLAENISIVKGAATVRYGPEALGGVILINPPKLRLSTDLEGEARVTGKTNGRSGEASMKLQKGFKRLALLGEASILGQGDLHTPNYNLTNTGKKEKSIALGALYHFSDIDLNVYYSHFDQELGILRGSVNGNLVDLENAIGREPPAYTRSFSYKISAPRQEVSHDLLKLKGTYNKNSHIVDLQYGFQRNQRKEFDVRRGSDNEVASIDLQLLSHTLDLDWKHPEFHSWFGSVGVQALYQDNNNNPGTNTVPFVPNYNNTRIGAYFIEAREFGTNTFEVGLRYDFQYSSIRGREPNNDIYRNELNYQNVTATLGLKTELQNGNVFRTNLGTAWRPPNISELYSFGKHQASIDYGLWRYSLDENNEITANDILTEEDKIVDSEVGLKWINTYEVNAGRFQGEFTFYVNYINNYIYSKPGGITQNVRGALPFFLYDQANALFTGVDLGFRLIHSDMFESQFKASYLYARNVESNQYFVELPPANLNYVLDAELDKVLFFSNSNLRLDVNYTFKQFNAPRIISTSMLLQAKQDDENLFLDNDDDFDILAPPSGYFIANLIWSVELKKFTTSVQLKNIFNNSYRIYTDRNRYFSDDTGRNFILSVKYKF